MKKLTQLAAIALLVVGTVACDREPKTEETVQPAPVETTATVSETSTTTTDVTAAPTVTDSTATDATTAPATDSTATK